MPTSTPAPSSELRPPARAASGFTLIELAIVLLILAIAASLVIPRLRNTDATALASSAARLASTARYLYEEAAFRGRPMRLNLDLDRHVYWVTTLADAETEDEDEFVPDETPLARPVALPDAVAFADVVLPAFGTVTGGVVFAQFLPEGWADPLVVHLTNRRSEYATLAVEPLTGRTRVGEGYLEVESRDPAAPRGRGPGGAIAEAMRRRGLAADRSGTRGGRMGERDATAR